MLRSEITHFRETMKNVKIHHVTRWGGISSHTSVSELEGHWRMGRWEGATHAGHESNEPRSQPAHEKHLSQSKGQNQAERHSLLAKQEKSLILMYTHHGHTEELQVPGFHSNQAVETDEPEMWLSTLRVGSLKASQVRTSKRAHSSCLSFQGKDRTVRFLWFSVL